MVEVIRELFKRAPNREEGSWWNQSSIPLENACRRKHNRSGTMDYVPNTRGTLVARLKRAVSEKARRG